MKFNVEKSIQIHAPMIKVRELVDDFKCWQAWSPWIVMEPSCRLSFTGEPNKPGHAMSWQGEIIGSGTITLRSSQSQSLDYDLAFFNPQKSKATARLLFEPMEQNLSRVTWTMDSNLPFFMFFMLKTMKNWIGMDYDRGLRMLKELVERGELKCQTTNEGLVDYRGFSYVGIQRSVAFSIMSQSVQKDFEKIVKDIVINGNKTARHWVCIYPKFDIKNMQVTYIAAVSDENIADLALDSEYIRSTIGGCKALEIKHDGAYNFLGNGWSMGMMHMRAKKLKTGADPFEQYWNSPMEEKPEDLKTSIYFPID